MTPQLHQNGTSLPTHLSLYASILDLKLIFSYDLFLPAILQCQALQQH